MKASTDAEPVPLLGPEVDIILNDNMILVEWTAATEYQLGDRVIPTDGNRTGRQFICVSPGTSDSDEEPDWSLFNRRAHTVVDGESLGNDASGGQTVSDGDVLWSDDGKCGDVWNLEEAAHECWLAKAAKAHDLHAMNRGGNNYDFETIYRHCTDMASRFGGCFIK